MKKINFLLCCALLCLGMGAARAQYTDMYNFNGGTTGANPVGSLTPSLSGIVFYGVTAYGGANGEGNIFSYTLSSGYTDLLNFGGTNNNGNEPCGSLTLSITGDTLFGMTEYGGANNVGNLFAYTIGGTYTDLLDFGGTNNNGNGPCGSLLISGKILYGMTSYGGTNGEGNIFSYTISAGYTDLADFGGTNNSANNPLGSLSLSTTGDTLFGMTEYGGVNSLGNVFAYTIGGSYTDLLDFSGIGGNPQGSLTVSGKMLYGMTAMGGANNDGNIFSIGTNGTGYTDMHDFDYLDGQLPLGALTLSTTGGNLYGMTFSGGGASNGAHMQSDENGAIFSINTNGSGFTDLLDFNGTDGGDATGSLIISNCMLYGMTTFGGTDGRFVALGNGGVLFGFSLSPIVTIASNVNVSCNGGSNGSVTAAVSAGESPYTYSWSGNAQTTATATGLSAGSYTVTVHGANGCMGTANIVITQPLPLTVTATALSDISCNGGDNGSISAAPSGGTAPYTYSWSDGETGPTASHLTAGASIVTVTDSHGCSETATATLTQPAPLVITSITEGCTGLLLTTTETVHVTGGTAPYTYHWAGLLGAFNTTSATASGFLVNIYTVTVTDNNGCVTGAWVLTINLSCIIHLSPTKHHDDDSSSAITQEETTISLYPNPSTGLFTIAGLQKGMLIEIYDGIGRKISNTTTSDETMQFNLFDRATGIYFIRILSEDGKLVSQKKVVKTE